MYAAERDEPGGAPSGTDYGKKPLSAVARKMLALDPQGAPPEEDLPRAASAHRVQRERATIV